MFGSGAPPKGAGGELTAGTAGGSSGRSPPWDGIVNCLGRFTGVTLCFGGGKGAAD
jgi:hypothetical protein